MRRFGWLIVVTWPLAALGQAPSPGPKPAPTPDTLASIEAEAKSAKDSWDAFFKNLERVLEQGKVPTRSEVITAQKAYHSRLLNLMDRALTLARLHPGQSGGIAEAAWVVQNSAILEKDDDTTERVDAAFRLLAIAPVLDDPKIAIAMFDTESLGLRCPEVEPFLRSILARSRNRNLIAFAQYNLGDYLAEMARMHDRLAAPVSGPQLLKVLTKDRLDRYRAIDAQKLRSEVEALLEQVTREQGEDHPTLGGLNADKLYRIRHLRIGQPTPELVGEDINGAPIRLSDFRGKVVVLSLWVTSGYPYMPIDEGKELVAAMKGRPFALVGVNGDAAEDRAKLKVEVTKGGIIWRSFWASGPHGAIPRKWGIDRWGAYGWRTVYTIDANGIIRDDQAGKKLTPAAFESLVQAAEKAAR